MIPLNKARICIECDIIFEGQVCPTCTSTNWYPLIKWINREETHEEDIMLEDLTKDQF